MFLDRLAEYGWMLCVLSRRQESGSLQLRQRVRRVGLNRAQRPLKVSDLLVVPLVRLF